MINRPIPTIPALDKGGDSHPEVELEILAKDLPASPGAATGTIVFTADEAEEEGKAGEAVILVRKETNPDDVYGMVRAKGLLTR